MRILMGVDPQPSDSYVALLAAALEARGHTVECSVEAALTPAPGVDLVHLHWPEALWGWGRAEGGAGARISRALDGWREHGTPLVWTRHNAAPHHDAGPEGERIRARVEEAADGIVHLGEYSARELPRPGTPAAVIPHGTYPVGDLSDRASARGRLGVHPDAFMVLVFGAVRHTSEQRMIVETAERLDAAVGAVPRGAPSDDGSPPPPVFSVPRWEDVTLPSRLRAPLRRLEAERIRARGRALLRTGGGFISAEAVGDWMAACDVVFVPRREVLNSGVLLLALSHGRTALGPRTGNLTEVLRATASPSFTPGDPADAARQLADLSARGAEERDAAAAEARDRAVERWSWDRLAEAHERFFGDVLRSTSPATGTDAEAGGDRA